MVLELQAILGGWGPALPAVHHQQHLFIPEGEDNDSSTLGEMPAWVTLFHSMTPLPFNLIPAFPLHLFLLLKGPFILLGVKNHSKQLRLSSQPPKLFTFLLPARGAALEGGS